MFVIDEAARKSQDSLGHVCESNQPVKDGALRGGHSQDSNRYDDACGVYGKSLASREVVSHASSSAS
jgi:hypothetical protein